MACCYTDSPPVAPSDITRTPWRRRVAMLVQWAVPLTTLALIPKCPLCVAAYVLLFTGVGRCAAASSPSASRPSHSSSSAPRDGHSCPAPGLHPASDSHYGGMHG